jgi:hypothetical protein
MKPVSTARAWSALAAQALKPRANIHPHVTTASNQAKYAYMSFYNRETCIQPDRFAAVTEKR